MPSVPPTSAPPRGGAQPRFAGTASVVLLAAAAAAAAFRLHVVFRFAYDARVARRKIGPALARFRSSTAAALRGGSSKTAAALTRVRATSGTALTRLRATSGTALTRFRSTSGNGARAIGGGGARTIGGGARTIGGGARTIGGGAKTIATGWGWGVDRLAAGVVSAGTGGVTVTGRATGRLAAELARAGRGAGQAAAAATEALGRGLPAAGGWLLGASGRLTGTLADGLERGGRAALAGTGAVTAGLAQGLPAAGSRLVTGTGYLLQLAASGLRVMTARFVPAVAGFVSIAVAIVTWGVVVTSAGGPTVASYAAAVDWKLELPEDTALPTLAERSVVYAGDGSVLAVLHDEIDRHIVPFEELPDHVWQAVITAEDRRFFEHEGYDIEAIGRAAVANVQARGITQGGSTITQQLAKENFVGDEQTLQRKAAEVTYAIALENRLDKVQLLERYLNQVYFGSGAYGIASAAEDFFGVEPSELTVDQAAAIAGGIRAPSALNPRSDPERATERRNAILDAMVEEGHLDRGEAEAAKHQPLELAEGGSKEIRQPYIVEAVKREFFTNPAFGETREDRIDYLFSGGLEIHTTIDPRLQDIAADAIDDRFGDDGPTGAIAAVDSGTGRVLAAQAGADFDASQYDLATQGRRQPGSAFKTFVFAAALEEGIPLDAVLDADSPIVLDFGGTEDWSVSNYGGNDYGVIDLQESLARSSNTAFAQLMLAVGQDPVVDLVDRLGIDVPAALGSESERGPSMALGGLRRGVTPLEMAAAYATFSNDGDHAPPYLIERVVDTDGNDIFEHDPEPRRVLDPDVSAAVTETLVEAVEDGTGGAAQLDDWEVAGKTGTTQRNADAWFVGYVPVLSTAVWVGHPEGQVRMPGMTGGSEPAALWREFMEEALADTDPEDFDVSVPSDMLDGSGRVEVPDLIGSTRTEALRELLEARLVGSVDGDEDGDTDDPVVDQSPEPGTEVDVGTEVEVDIGETWQLPAGQS